MGERKQDRQLTQHNLRIGPAENRLALFGSEDVLEHPLDAPLLLLVVRMDVDVHRRGDVGMPEDDAHGLDGVFALDAARGEAMPHPVELQFGYIKVVNAPADWMDALGALVIIVAGNSTISGIRFENVSINSCSFYPINLTLAEESNSGTINDITFSHIAIPNNNAIRLNNAAAKGKLGNIHFDNITRNEKKVTNQNELILSKNGVLGTLDVK